MSRIILTEKGKQVLSKELMSKIKELTMRYAKKYKRNENMVITKVLNDILPLIRERVLNLDLDFDSVLRAAIIYIKQLLNEQTQCR